MNNFRKNKKQKRDGYTMIEILVVISIIGFMLSVAMYLLTSARENARIARNMQFADTIRAKLGSSMIGSWAFDEGSGSNANDGWATNNGCLTKYSTADWVSGILNKAYFFVSDSDGSTSFNFPVSGCGGTPVTGSLSPAITSNDITITAWFKASPGSAGGTIVAIGDARAYGLITSGGNIGKVQAPSNYSTVISSKDYRDDKWHFVAVKMGSGGVSIWVDATLDGNSLTGVDLYKDSSNDPSLPTVLRVGLGQGSGWGGFNGTIDDVKLYNESLTAQEIHKYYSESANKYQVAVK